MGTSRAVVAGLSGVVLAVAPLAGASAHSAPKYVVVAQKPTKACGMTAKYSTIQAGVNAVRAHGIVVVCPGTYHEDVLVTKPVRLYSRHAVVAPDKTDTNPLAKQIGGNNAFTVLAPWVTIAGFDVRGATGDGMFVAGDHATVVENAAYGNGINGVNLDGSSWSTVRRNKVFKNNGGIELANDPIAAGISMPGVSGTAAYDRVVDNVVTDNPAACAIYIVDHAGGMPTNPGLHDNLIKGNVVERNALKGFGAGVLLASPAPGAKIFDNTITENWIRDNGLPGVSVHSHVPGQDFHGNAITRNVIGTNNKLGAETDDKATTGIYVGSHTPLKIRISDNVIYKNHYGIFTAGPVTVTGKRSNSFVKVDIHVKALATYTG